MSGFARYRILGWFFFPLNTLNVLAHCLLNSKVSGDKPVLNLIKDHLNVMGWFSLAASNTLLLFEFGQFDFNVCQFGFLLIDLTWSSLSLLYTFVHVFHQIWKVPGHYFFKWLLCPFLSSPSGIPTIHMMVCLMMCHRSLKLYSHLFLQLFFFLFLRLDNLNYPVFKLMGYFATQTFLWMSLVYFTFQLSFLKISLQVFYAFTDISVYFYFLDFL